MMTAALNLQKSGAVFVGVDDVDGGDDGHGDGDETEQNNGIAPWEPSGVGTWTNAECEHETNKYGFDQQ